MSDPNRLDRVMDTARREWPESLPVDFAAAVMAGIQRARKDEHVLPVIASAGGFSLAAAVAMLVGGVIGSRPPEAVAEAPRPVMELFGPSIARPPFGNP